MRMRRRIILRGRIKIRICMSYVEQSGAAVYVRDVVALIAARMHDPAFNPVEFTAQYFSSGATAASTPRIRCAAHAFM